MNVLLVDDERLALGVMAGGLRNHGILVTEASSGTEALTLWRECSFDVLLTDIAMPDMSGVELARRICQIDDMSPNHTPSQMVALTGNYAYSDDDDQLQHVFDQVLCKPITVTAVAQALNTLGSKGPSPRQQARATQGL